MTLLQTRVEDKVARRFSRVAKARGLTPYSLLQKYVKETATADSRAEGWEDHWKWLESLNVKPLPYNAVARDREEAGER